MMHPALLEPPRAPRSEPTLALAATCQTHALVEPGLGSCDAELTAALMAEHPRAALVAWQRFSPLVRSMVRRRMRSDADVEDLVQEVFSELFQSVRRLRQPSALTALVVIVTRRLLGRELRRRRARAHIRCELDPERMDPVGLVADPSAMHACAHLGRLLSRLRARDRRAFLLRYVQDLEAEEVGAEMGISAPTARRSFLRARARLRLWASRNAFLSDFVPG